MVFEHMLHCFIHFMALMQRKYQKWTAGFQPEESENFLQVINVRMSTKGKLVVWGPVVWNSNRVPLSNNPFHKGIPNIQTTDPDHQLAIT